MTGLEILGWAMIAVPFVAIFIMIAVQDGVKVAAAIFLFTAVVFGWIKAGSYLSGGGL